MKLKTAHSCTPQQLPAATATAVASLPGPVMGPQSTSAGGKRKPLRLCWSMRARASAFEQAASAEEAVARLKWWAPLSTADFGSVVATVGAEAPSNAKAATVTPAKHSIARSV
ncbi:MAG: hypothetical protein ACLP7F_06605 [Acidimicrobiales bacterium]